MSQVAICSKINSQPVGIADNGQGYIPVQLNTDINSWTRTAQSTPNDYLFNINALTADDQGLVVATDDPSGNHGIWHVVYHSNCDAYTIEVVNSNPLVGWTVSEPSDPESQIVVASLDISQCDTSQLFEIK